MSMVGRKSKHIYVSNLIMVQAIRLKTKTGIGLE